MSSYQDIVSSDLFFDSNEHSESISITLLRLRYNTHSLGSLELFPEIFIERWKISQSNTENQSTKLAL